MNAYDIIIAPIVSESSTEGIEQKKYTFRVDPRANKYQIKDAVEEIFKVDVARVNTMHVVGKEKRQGRYTGFTRSWKKAIVTLTPDSKEIQIFEGL